MSDNEKFQLEYLELSGKTTKLDKEMTEHNDKLMTDLSGIEKNLIDIKENLKEMNNKMSSLPSELDFSDITNKQHKIYLAITLILLTVFALLWTL